MNEVKQYPQLNDYQRRALQTRARRAQSDSRKRATEQLAQLKLYMKAMARARKNGTTLPLLSDFTEVQP